MYLGRNDVAIQRFTNILLDFAGEAGFCQASGVGGPKAEVEPFRLGCAGGGFGRDSGSGGERAKIGRNG